MTFAESSYGYFVLRQKLQNNEITYQMMQAMIESLRVSTVDGSIWQPSVSDGTWTKWNGKRWVVEKPPSDAGLINVKYLDISLDSTNANYNDISQGSINANISTNSKEMTLKKRLAKRFLAFLKSVLTLPKDLIFGRTNDYIKPQKPVDGLPSFAVMLGKGMLKGFISRTILSLIVGLAVWIYHTYFLVVVNEGFGWDPNSKGGASLIAVPANLNQAIVFWTLAAGLFMSLLAQFRMMGIIKYFKSIFSIPRYISESVKSTKKYGVVFFLISMTITLLVSPAITITLTRLILAIGAIDLLKAGYNTLPVTIVRLAYYDFQKIFYKKRPRKELKPQPYYMMVLGAAVGMLVSAVFVPSRGGQTGVYLIIAITAIISFLVCLLIIRKKPVPRAALIIIGIAGITFLFPFIKVLADDGGWAEAGGTFERWWNSVGADLARRMGIPPAMYGAFAAWLLSMGGKLPPNMLATPIDWNNLTKEQRNMVDFMLNQLQRRMMEDDKVPIDRWTKMFDKSWDLKNLLNNGRMDLFQLQNLFNHFNKWDSGYFDPVHIPSNWEIIKEGFQGSVRELFTGRTADGNFSYAAFGGRLIAGFLSGGSSEYLFIPVGASYTVYDTGSLTAGLSQAVKEALLNYIGGKLIEGGGKLTSELAQELAERFPRVAEFGTRMLNGLDDINNWRYPGTGKPPIPEIPGTGGIPHTGRPGLPDDGLTTGGRPGLPDDGLTTGGRPGIPDDGLTTGGRPGRPGAPDDGLTPGGRPGAPDDGLTPGGRPGAPDDGLTPGGRPGEPHGQSEPIKPVKPDTPEANNINQQQSNMMQQARNEAQQLADKARAGTLTPDDIANASTKPEVMRELKRLGEADPDMAARFDSSAHNNVYREPYNKVQSELEARYPGDKIEVETIRTPAKPGETQNPINTDNDVHVWRTTRNPDGTVTRTEVPPREWQATYDRAYAQRTGYTGDLNDTNALRRWGQEHGQTPTDVRHVEAMTDFKVNPDGTTNWGNVKSGEGVNMTDPHQFGEAYRYKVDHQLNSGTLSGQNEGYQQLVKFGNQVQQGQTGISEYLIKNGYPPSATPRPLTPELSSALEIAKRTDIAPSVRDALIRNISLSGSGVPAFPNGASSVAEVLAGRLESMIKLLPR